MIIHEHGFHIGVEGLAHRVIGKSSSGIAFVWALKIVLRGGVVLGGVGPGEDRGQRAPSLRVLTQRARCGAKLRKPDRVAIGRIGRAAAFLRLGRIERRGQACLVLNGAGAAIALRLEHGIGPAIADIGGDMAQPIAEPAAKRQGGIEHAPIGIQALGIGVTTEPLPDCIIQQRADRGVAIVMGVEAVGDIQAHPAEMRVHHKIDHASHRIGAIGGGGPAGQHIHAFDERGGNEVDVCGGRAGIARHHPAAIDQHQRAPRPQPAQIRRGNAGGPVRQGGGLAGIDLRQGVENILNPRGAGPLHILRGDGRDRRAGGDIGGMDARAGHDNLGSIPRRTIARPRRCRQRGNAQQQWHGGCPQGLSNPACHVAPRHLNRALAACPAQSIPRVNAGLTLMAMPAR